MPEGTDAEESLGKEKPSGIPESVGPFRNLSIGEVGVGKAEPKCVEGDDELEEEEDEDELEAGG